jgi:hypothetical protein
MTFWLRLLLAILACWRISHLLAAEDGPAGLIARFRVWIGNHLIGQMLDCFLCMSVWVSLPLAFFVTRALPDVLVVWWAVSGGACLLERLKPPEVTIQTLPDESHGEGEEEHGMLRSAKNGH